jgi:hypothetical protein
MRSFAEPDRLREEHLGIIAASQPLRAERRLKSRYQLELCVHFRLLSGSFFSGTGCAVNLSSSGVLVVSPQIVSQQDIGMGAGVEMNFEWPVRLDGRIALQLFALGLVVRRGTFDFAVEFERHEFRTLRNSVLPHARLRDGIVRWHD